MIRREEIIQEICVEAGIKRSPLNARQMEFDKRELGHLLVFIKMTKKQLGKALEDGKN